MIAEKSHANLKKVLETTIDDLSKLVVIIKEMVENQLQKIHLQYIEDKNGNIKPVLNIWLFIIFIMRLVNIL